MKLPQQMRIAELFGHISRLANKVHIRLVLTIGDDESWVARSLVVDVFPQRWLANSSGIFTEYEPPRFLYEFPNQALFFAGLVHTPVVAGWLAHPDACELSHFDDRDGLSDRRLPFRMHELHQDVIGMRLNSRVQDRYAMLPWPHNNYSCTLKEANVYRRSDDEVLYAVGQGHFDNFREARAKLIHDVADLNRSRYDDRDEVDIRVIDGDGWIKEVHKRGTRFDVSVGGLALHPGHLILKRGGVADEEREIMGPRPVAFEFQSDPPQLDIILTNDSMQLDRARYISSPSPGMGISTAHVVIEQDPAGDSFSSGQSASRVESHEVKETGKHMLRVVVASPKDVQKERDSLMKVRDELNEGIAGYLGLELKVWRWETDAYPGFHTGGAQGQIDQIMQIEDADIVIGIFWTRFGTPVSDAQSGTEHELLRAYEMWKRENRPHIMIYFRAQGGKNVDAEQLLALQNFKRRFPSEGLWWPYPNTSEFPNIVRQHLTKLLIREYGTKQ